MTTPYVLNLFHYKPTPLSLNVIWVYIEYLIAILLIARGLISSFFSFSFFFLAVSENYLDICQFLSLHESIFFAFIKMLTPVKLFTQSFLSSQVLWR